jgi:hypothetical protein
MAAPDIPLICYDFTEVSRFFRSVAMTIALQRNTLLEWSTYRDSLVLNGIYSALFWKAPPGTVEVRTADRLAMEEEVDKLHERFVLAWLRKLHEGGPEAGNAYVDHMAEVRQAARDALDDVLHDAARMNSEVAGETRDAIVMLARYRLAAGVGVAVIGGAAGIAFAAAAAGGGAAAAGGITVFGLQAGASGAAFGTAGLGISVTNTIVKTWENGPEAKLAAVSMDAGKAAVSEAGGTVAQSAVHKALTQQARSEQIIRSAEAMIKQHSERLARDDLRKGSLRKSRNIVEKSTRQVARESDALTRAGNLARQAGTFAKGIPVVFAAMDIIGALGDYQQVMSTQQESP